MPPLVVIVGETASGKSALAMELAQKYRGEIICADSWTVYKGFDIGTAKPSAEDRALVPHHLLDIADATEGFSAAVFQRLAKEAIADISRRGKLPIMVGGTGLYIDSVLYDYSFLPASDPEVRKRLNALTISELIEKLAEQDISTVGIDIRNKRRLIRLIENSGRRPTKHSLRANTLVFGILRSHAELTERITKRLDKMVSQGFVDEVRHLGRLYGWDCEPMRAPDYKAFADYVQGRVTLDDAKARVLQNDLQLAKKQRTWFRRNHSIHWISDRSYTDDILTTFLNKRS